MLKILIRALVCHLLGVFTPTKNQLILTPRELDVTRESGKVVKSVSYDPLICKLVSYGSTRGQCLHVMCDALDSYVIRGVTHNVPLLRDIITEKRFVSGDITTNYLPEMYPEGFLGKQLNSTEVKDLVAIAASVYAKRCQRARSFANLKRATKVLGKFPEKFDFKCQFGDDEEHEVHVDFPMNAGKKIKVRVDEGHECSFDNNFTLADTTLKCNMSQGKQYIQLISHNGTGKIQIQFYGTIYDVNVLPKRVAELMHYMPEKPEIDYTTSVIAPMPGMVKSVDVEVGQDVVEGQSMLVLEAMKMQNSMLAGKTGKVKAINCKVGETVDEGSVLVELE